jgi:hypothetical protein
MMRRPIRWFCLAIAAALLIYAAGPAAGAGTSFKSGPYFGQTLQAKRVTFTATFSKLTVTKFKFSVREPCSAGSDLQRSYGPFTAKVKKSGASWIFKAKPSDPPLAISFNGKLTTKGKATGKINVSERIDPSGNPDPHGNVTCHASTGWTAHH